MANGIDCASKLIASTAKGLKAAGVDYVGRYLGPSNSWKALTASEVTAINEAGLKIWSIYETSPTSKAYFSKSKGESDAKAAASYAESIGQPKGTPIYFAVDYDAQTADLPAILAYFQGARSASTDYKVGAYASYSVLSYLHDHSAADFYWQTYAWSRGNQAHFACLYQHQNGVSVAGVSADLDQILSTIGGWTNTVATTLLESGSKGSAVKTLQENLNKVLNIKLATDGIFGAKTLAAVKSFQQIYHLTVDGIVGPKTKSALKTALSKVTASASKSTSSISTTQQAINLLNQAISLLKEDK